jgi:hypothetical protein
VVPNDDKTNGLITVNTDRFVAKVKSGEKYELGDLGEAHLRTSPKVNPRIPPCRNIPVALKDDVKTELDGLVGLGVLVQYMARFLPNLANNLGSIRALTRKETVELVDCLRPSV